MSGRPADSSVAVHQAEDLQHKEQLFSALHYSYDLVQRLTYYIVSAQLVTCGYILLNSSSLLAVNNLSYVFLLSGLSAFMGILWRYFYNITYYNRTHGINNWQHACSSKLQKVIYWVYVLLTIVSFILLLTSGFCYLKSLNID